MENEIGSGSPVEEGSDGNYYRDGELVFTRGEDGSLCDKNGQIILQPEVNLGREDARIKPTTGQTPDNMGRVEEMRSESYRKVMHTVERKPQNFI